LLFTNESVFPYRHDIEILGVTIVDDLVLTRKNEGIWSSVLFFFDVINYIKKSKLFIEDDNFILLDTDVLAIKGCNILFDYIDLHNCNLAYSIGIYDEDFLFHNKKISNLNALSEVFFGESNSNKIKTLIGGEFFGFKKANLTDILRISDYFLNYSDLTTEEQILSIINAQLNFCFFNNTIFRVWTSYKFYKVPKDNNYFFLHFPAEKKFGIFYLFESLKKLNNNDFLRYSNLVKKYIPFTNKFRLFLFRLYFKIKFDFLTNFKW